MVEAYDQMDRNRKILIVDDWHKLKYGDLGQAILLEQAEKCFGPGHPGQLPHSFPNSR